MSLEQRRQNRGHNFRTGVYLFMHAAPLYSEDDPQDTELRGF